jgi:hypothetical protein
MASRGPVYKEENAVIGKEFLDELNEAVDDLAQKMKASLPIKNGTCNIGFGVSKAHRSLAADRVISIARAIKSLKGW